MKLFERIEKLYVDTNILVNYCTGNGRGREELIYIFKQRDRGRVEIYTSALCLVQTMSQLQIPRERYNRERFDGKKTAHHIKKLLSEFKILKLDKNHVKKAILENNDDMEDNVQYQILKEAGCKAIFTDNQKDFKSFPGLIRIEPIMGMVKARI